MRDLLTTVGSDAGKNFGLAVPEGAQVMNHERLLFVAPGRIFPFSADS
jgi:hypothetical protein